MVTHSNILAWRIPWTEEPGGLQSIASQRVGHDRNDLAHMAYLTYFHKEKRTVILYVSTKYFQ